MMCVYVFFSSSFSETQVYFIYVHTYSDVEVGDRVLCEWEEAEDEKFPGMILGVSSKEVEK